MSGAMFSAGRAGDPPTSAGTHAVDAITAYSAFEGALAALLHRERTGEGQLVTVNMLDAAIAVQMQELSVFTVGGVPQHRGAEAHGYTYIRAWLDPAADARAAGFYSATRRTVESAWVRPRFAGYLEFQARASAVLRDGLISGEDHEVLLGQVNDLFTRASTGIPARYGAYKKKREVPAMTRRSG
jgi:crotonobetainyl-CoA:carnitine CoA-transferase CaiB-like acyl-CoA transferase